MRPVTRLGFALALAVLALSSSAEAKEGTLDGVSVETKAGTYEVTPFNDPCGSVLNQFQAELEVIETGVTELQALIVGNPTTAVKNRIETNEKERRVDRTYTVSRSNFFMQTGEPAGFNRYGGSNAPVLEAAGLKSSLPTYAMKDSTSPYNHNLIGRAICSG